MADRPLPPDPAPVTPAPPGVEADPAVPPPPKTTGDLVMRLLALGAVLFLFVIALEVMGTGIKGISRTNFDLAGLLEGATNTPLLALITGILVTSLVQSSSTTTSLTVTLVATGTLSIEGAIPVIMGANIGTTVTNTIVSMGHITRPEEFRRAMAGATVHDFFNWTAVLLLLPLELAFGILSKSATAIAGLIPGLDTQEPGDTVFDVVGGWVYALLGENPWLGAAAGLLMLFIALRYLVVVLKSLVLGRSEGMLHKYIFGAPLVAMLAGMVLTFMVQSSSVTTSIVIPLVGAGILTVRQVFPYMLGSNVGTTATGLLAAAVAVTSGEPAAAAALVVALCHMLFNVFGIALIYPVTFIREIPIRMAEFVGELAFKNRAYAIAYLVGLFYVLPFVLELILPH
jgi:sodium-dependent phosphate cotransporter